MDPVTVIMATLAAAARDGTPDAVKGAYAQFRDAVRALLAGRPGGELALAKYEVDPQAWRALLAEELARARAGDPLLRLRGQSVYLLNMLGDRAELAISAAEPLVADCERMLGADHPDTLASRSNLAVAYRAAGRTTEAFPLYQRTLADCERVLGASHPDTLMSRRNLATAYHAAGRTVAATALLQRTLADCERVLGAHHPDTDAVRADLAAVTGKQKRRGRR